MVTLRTLMLAAGLSAALALPMMAQEGQVVAASTLSPQAVEASRQRLLKLIPAPLPSQAAAVGAVEFYGPESLYKYMDGGADVYLPYQFQQMLHQEFKAKAADVTVDIFDMGADENAFGIYASERSPSYSYIAMGTEGYANDGILNFLQGRFYMKLSGYGDGNNAVMAEFAKAISAKIGEKPEPPAILAKLPKENRKPHTEQFVPQDPLGYSFLGPAFMALYGDEKQESTLMISLAENAADAQARMKQLSDHFRTSGKCAPAPELGEGAIRASSSSEGSVIARATGRFVVVMINPATVGEATFQETVKRLTE